VLKYRGLVHKLRDEKIIYIAMQEGKRTGYAEGVAAGTTTFTRAGHTHTVPVTDWELRERNEEVSDDESVTDTEETYRNDVPNRAPSVTSERTTRSRQADPAPPPSRPPSARPVPPPRSPSPPPTRVRPPDAGIHPTILHNIPRSPSHGPIDIPPEGWIPELEGGAIRLPPPHELSRPPPTPEQLMSPTLPPQRPPSIPQPPPPRPPSESARSVRSHKSHRSHKSRSSRRAPSPAESSGSTSISEHPLTQPSVHAYSPMSVIPEVRSNEQSPEDRAIPRPPPGSSPWVRVLCLCVLTARHSNVYSNRISTKSSTAVHSNHIT